MSDPGIDRHVYDAIVVGSGPSGSFAAKELTERGLSVLMLEAGREISPSDFDPARKPKKVARINIRERVLATLRGRSVQSRSLFFRGLMTDFFVNDRDNPYTTPHDAPYTWIRGRQAGGRTHTFGRVLLRWSDHDFQARSKTGRGVDWPISYDDLAPYYAEVEQCLGIYGNRDTVETLPDGVYKGPAKLSPAEQHFRQALENRWPGRRAVAWRATSPDPLRVFRPLRDAIGTGRLTVRYDTIVRRIVTDGNRATGVEVVHSGGGGVSAFRASHVILCASPIETVRLMLLSASAEHPGGIGNSSGLLGRFFMDQLPALGLGCYPPGTVGWSGDDSQPADPFYDPSGGVFVPRFDVAGRPQASGGFAFQGVVGRNPIGSGEPASLLFLCYGEMQPHADNRITLDASRKDRWGIPVPHIRCAMHDGDRAMLAQLEECFLETISEAGGRVEFLGSPGGFREWGRGAYPGAGRLSRFAFRRLFGRVMVMGAAIHESGGARMGTDPTNSVLNRWGQCWDVPNLLVTDASAFPTGGVSGTTLTIMAQSVRACRHLATGAQRHDSNIGGA